MNTEKNVESFGEVSTLQENQNTLHLTYRTTEHANNLSGTNLLSNGECTLFSNSDDISFVLETNQTLRTRKQLIFMVMSAAVGNFLEWFDFAIFAMLADEIGTNFFPPGAQEARLLLTYAVFASAFFMRPFGGLLFGYIGDKYGRLYALRLSIFMMAIPTFLTGCLPNYETIGISSTILLVILRLIQGISVGGEISGALVYVLEICPQNHKALFAQFVYLSAAGTLLASAMEAILRSTLTHEQLYTWGWRLPFLFGISVAVVGIWTRKQLPISLEYQQIKKLGNLKSNPVKEVLCTSQIWKVITIFFQLSLPSCNYYTLFAWMPTYLLFIRKNPIQSAFILNVIAQLLASMAALGSAYLADKLTNTKIILVCGCFYLVLLMILFPIIAQASEFYVWVSVCTLAIGAGAYGGPNAAWSVSILTQGETRYSSLGIGYNLSVGLFGGTAPFISTAVSEYAGIAAVGWILFAYGTLSLSSVAVYIYYSGKNNDKKISKVENKSSVSLIK